MSSLTVPAGPALATPATEPAAFAAANDQPTQVASALNARWEFSSASELLRDAIAHFPPGRLAVVSSFGADAAVLLHLIAEIDRNLPILFIDTGKHFTETLMYRDILVGRFGFTDARAIEPDTTEVQRLDPKGDLWSRDPNLCCQIRKVDPLQRALDGVDAWITGRKRYQTSARAALPVVEAVGGRIKINPLANWSEEAIRSAFRRFKLPPHPLFDEGYRSIGCAPCTKRVAEDEDSRAGRWSGTDKTECGIHI